MAHFRVRYHRVSVVVEVVEAIVEMPDELQTGDLIHAAKREGNEVAAEELGRRNVPDHLGAFLATELFPDLDGVYDKVQKLG